MNKKKFIKKFFKDCSRRDIIVDVNNSIFFHIDAVKIQSIPETELILPKEKDISKISIKFKDYKDGFGYKYAVISIKKKHNMVFSSIDYLSNQNTSIPDRIKLIKIIAYMCKKIDITVYYDTMKLKDLSYIYNDGDLEQSKSLINSYDFPELLFSDHYEDDDTYTISGYRDRTHLYHIGNMKDGTRCYLDLKHYSEFSNSMIFEDNEGYIGCVNLPIYRDRSYTFNELYKSLYWQIPICKMHYKYLFAGFVAENQKDIYNLIHCDLVRGHANIIYHYTQLKLYFENYMDKFDTGTSELPIDAIKLSADKTVGTI